MMIATPSTVNFRKLFSGTSEIAQIRVQLTLFSRAWQPIRARRRSSAA
jgi:hypothetical protein